MPRLTIMIVSILLLSACSWMKRKPVEPELPKATVPGVVVIRESTPNSVGVPMSFGEADQVYLELDNNQYGSWNSIPGLHRFIISAKGSANFEMELNIQPNTIVCIKAYANPAYDMKTADPAPTKFMNIFLAEVIACPPNNIPPGYKRIGTNQ